MLYVISLGQLHVELATYKLGDPLNTFLLLALCLSQHSIHRTPIRETMYTSLQNRRRLNQLSLPLQLLHIPIRAHKLPLQEPRLLARQPQEKMRRQTHVVEHCRIDFITKAGGSEHVCVYSTGMGRDDEEVWILDRDILEELELGELGAVVGGSAHGERAGLWYSNQVGVEGDKRGIVVSEGEEGTSVDHCSFHICLENAPPVRRIRLRDGTRRGKDPGVQDQHIPFPDFLCRLPNGSFVRDIGGMGSHRDRRKLFLDLFRCLGQSGLRATEQDNV